MRKVHYLIIGVFLCVTGYAQKPTISGVVIDKDLNEPLTGVKRVSKGTQPNRTSLMENMQGG